LPRRYLSYPVLTCFDLELTWFILCDLDMTLKWPWGAIFSKIMSSGTVLSPFVDCIRHKIVWFISAKAYLSSPVLNSVDLELTWFILCDLDVTLKWPWHAIFSKIMSSGTVLSLFLDCILHKIVWFIFAKEVPELTCPNFDLTLSWPCSDLAKLGSFD
jgi:hypothetical protein